jgi:PhzF family phenazine biosynthesis protein
VPATDPHADYGVRIFTPRSELDFAGHPTLATAFALSERGGFETQLERRRFVQQCRMGLVPIDIEGRDGTRFFTMTQGAPVHRSAALTHEAAARLVGLSSAELLDAPLEVVSTGVSWLIVGLTDHRAVARVRPALAEIEQVSRTLDCDGVVVFGRGAENPQCQMRLRTFAPLQGITEDPVCGSGNGAVAAFLDAHGLWPNATDSYWAEQGVELNRAGCVRLQVQPDAEGGRAIRVGGHAVKAAEGTLFG